MNVSDFVVEQLHSMGVRRAFGIVGGGIAYFYNSIIKSAIKLHQFRHESGAGFAATEAYFSEGKPTVVFTTTGPGLLNALTGICAAKWEGAKVVMLSAASSPDQRGKWPIQETSHFTYPCSGLLSGGVLFDLSVQVESPEELAVIFHRLAAGLSGPGGFIARISLPTSIQTASIEVDSTQWQQDYGPAPAICASPSMIEQCAARLRDETFAIWLGYGAVNDTELCIRLARMTGARVFSSCRAKGIFPENDPLYLGVTGIGGHESVIDYMVNERPDWVLVLGSRLGEATSFWDHRMLPGQGFIQVDIDREVLGSAFPQCQTVAIQSEIALFLQMLMDRLEPSWFESRKIASVTNYTMVNTARSSSPEASASSARVSPLRLMSTIQKEIVDGSDALIMSECGNAFLWTNHTFVFLSPAATEPALFSGQWVTLVLALLGQPWHCRRKQLLLLVMDLS